MLNIAFDPDLVGTRGLRPAPEGDVQPLRNQLLANARDRSQAGAQSAHNLVVGAPLPEGIIGEQEDASVGQFARRRLASGNDQFQVRPLVRRECHPVLVHVGHPELGVYRSPYRQGSGYCTYLPNED